MSLQESSPPAEANIDLKERQAQQAHGSKAFPRPKPAAALFPSPSQTRKAHHLKWYQKFWVRNTFVREEEHAQQNCNRRMEKQPTPNISQEAKRAVETLTCG